MKNLQQRKRSIKTKRAKTKDRVKVSKKVTAFRRESRKRQRKLQGKKQVKPSRIQRDAALALPNSWPGKEAALRDAQDRRDAALEERKRKRDEAKARKKWVKEHPEAAAVQRAREKAKAAQAEAAAEKNRKDSQSFPVQLRKCLARCNCLFMVLDARAPLASLSHTVEAALAEQQSAPDAQEVTVVYVLSKVDLVPRSNIDAWIEYLKKVLVDDPERQIKRRLTMYSSQIVESPGMLLKQLQTEWLKGVKRHQITAALIGLPFVGKHTLARDLEVSSQVVSVHSAAQLGLTGTRSIQGRKSVSLLLLPRDTTRASKPPEGMDIIFKHPDAHVSDCALMGVADAIVGAADASAGGRKSLCLRYRLPLFEGKADEFLRQLGQKRGLDMIGAGKQVCKDICGGRFKVCSAVPAEVHPLPSAPAGGPNANLCTDTHKQVLNKCSVPSAQVLPVDSDAFKTTDFVLAEVEKKSKKRRRLADGEAPGAPDPEEADEREEEPGYEFRNEDWDSDEEDEEEEDEEEEDEEDDDDAPAPQITPGKEEAPKKRSERAKKRAAGRAQGQLRSASAKRLSKALGHYKGGVYPTVGKKRGR